jgi:hypothetical protein
MSGPTYLLEGPRERRADLRAALRAAGCTPVQEFDGAAFHPLVVDLDVFTDIVEEYGHWIELVDVAAEAELYLALQDIPTLTTDHGGPS